MIYMVWTNDDVAFYASRKGARRSLEQLFQEHWAKANDPNDRVYGSVWAERYRTLDERAARNSFMRANIRCLNVQP